MSQPCPPCAQPELSLLRLVLIGEILCAEEPWLLRLVDVLQQAGLVCLAEPPTAPHLQLQPGTLSPLRRPDAAAP